MKQQIKRFQKHNGFTILELTIAMLFITFILIFCATTLVTMLRLYDKGTAIKQMNQATRLVNDELARTIRSTPNVNLIKHPPLTDRFDRICVENTMYIWNVLYNNDGTPLSESQATRNRVNGRPVGLAKLNVTDTDVCSQTNSFVRNDGFSNGEIEILGGAARIAQADFSKTSDGRVYTFDFLLSTYAASELRASISDRTITPAQHNSNNPVVTCQEGDIGNYCFTNQMILRVYAANIKE